MKTMNDWLNEGRSPRFGNELYMNKRVVCADGYSLSIQASSTNYCEPREDIKDVSAYESFELGFPSSKDEEIMEWAEDQEDPTGTVYGWVPRDVVEVLIKKHGGVVSI